MPVIHVSLLNVEDRPDCARVFVPRFIVSILTFRTPIGRQRYRYLRFVFGFGIWRPLRLLVEYGDGESSSDF